MHFQTILPYQTLLICTIFNFWKFEFVVMSEETSSYYWTTWTLTEPITIKTVKWEFAIHQRFIPNYGTNVLKVVIFLFEIYFKIDREEHPIYKYILNVKSTNFSGMHVAQSRFFKRKLLCSFYLILIFILKRPPCI